MTNKQPEALRLADELDCRGMNRPSWKDQFDAGYELRRLHKVNVELVEALTWALAGIRFDPIEQPLAHKLWTDAKAVLAKAERTMTDSQCERCGEANPAEIHTCTPKQEPLAQMKEMLEVQGRDGTWNYDPYSQGMFNGMEFMVALAEGRDPVFREAPEKWIYTIPPQPDAVINGMPAYEGPLSKSQRLAQPEPEPVAWMHDSHVGFNVPLYTAPPQREWQGLTDEEREEAIGWSVEHIEAKLKEKNG